MVADSMHWYSGLQLAGGVTIGMQLFTACPLGIRRSPVVRAPCAGLLRIVEYGTVSVAAVDIHGPIQIFRRHMIATQRFDNRWSNEASQFGGVRSIEPIPQMS